MHYISYLLEIIWNPFQSVEHKQKEIDAEIDALNQQLQTTDSQTKKRDIEIKIKKLRKKREFWE